VKHCLNCGGALKIIAAIEDPPVIDKILSHLGLPTRARRHAQLVELIYSRQSDSRKPPANASRRRDREPFARLSTALPPVGFSSSRKRD
jgi:hypothetical protein